MQDLLHWAHKLALYGLVKLGCVYNFDYMKKLLQILRENRLEKGISQEYLAGKLGISSSTISRWESKGNFPSTDKLFEYASFLDLSCYDVLASMESSVYQDLIDRLNRIEQYVERTTHLLQDIDDELEMSTKDLIDTLDVSESTLYRWRKKNIVRFRYTESGDVRYFYKSLLICARCNRLRISGMRNDELLERLLRYKDKLILCNCLSLEQKDEP